MSLPAPTKKFNLTSGFSSKFEVVFPVKYPLIDIFPMSTELYEGFGGIIDDFILALQIELLPSREKVLPGPNGVTHPISTLTRA